MNGPGAIVQHERLSKKLTLDRVHRETKIKMEYLEAIEHDDVSAFPAELYYKNFLKVYAKYLYLDAAEMINIYEQVKIEKHQEYLRLNRKDNLKEQFVKFYLKYKKAIALSLICLTVLFFILIVVKIVNNINTAIPDVDDIDSYMQNAVVSQQIAENKDNEIKEDSSQVQESVQKQDEAVPAENTVKENVAVVEKRSQENTTEEISKSVQADTQEITLQINAKQNSWIKLTSDKRTSFEGILQKGHHYTSKAKNRFLLKIGNTDGVEVLFNDKPVDVSKGKTEGKVSTLEFKRD